MVKYFCDRCGKEIELGKYMWFRHKTVYADIRWIPAQYQADPTSVDHRICPDCENSFIKWFNHPEADNDRS